MCIRDRCTVSQVNFEIMLNRLLDIINPDEDSLRVYRLREPKSRYVKEYGIYQTINFQDPLVLQVRKYSDGENAEGSLSINFKGKKAFWEK